MKACWLVALLFIYHAALAGLSIQVEPTTIHLGETFHITLTLDTVKNRTIPDLTPFLKDFDIVGTGRNIAYTVINGEARSISQWGIILKPKKTGTLIIPSIQVGLEQSPQKQVTVEPNTQNTDGSTGNNTHIVVETENKKPYVHQQVIYTVRLLATSRLLDAQYHPPHVDDALLIPLGEGRHYQTEINGQPYAIEEQPYAIFPQKPGNLTITPPSLDALALGEFGPDHIHLEAKPLTLNVLPIPSGQSKTNWLPSHELTLKETYDTPKTKLVEGDTVVRTITLKAKGSVAELLPIPTFHNTAEYRIYTDKPTTQNEIDNGEVTGSARIELTYLLHQSGKIILPAIQIPWYNTVTQENEVAMLPEHTIVVQPKPQNKKTLPKASPIQTQHIKKSSHSQGLPFLVWWIGALISIGILCFLGWRWQKQKRPLKPHPEILTTTSLRAACKENNPHQAKAALLQWAKIQWPNQVILNLSDLPVTDPTFKAALLHLSQALYASKESTVWSGAILWQCVSAFKPEQKPKKKNKAKLPPMNPSRN